MKVTFQVGDLKLTPKEAKSHLSPEVRREMARRYINELLKSIDGAKVTV